MDLGEHIEARHAHVGGPWTDVIERAREQAGVKLTTKTVENIRKGRTQNPGADKLRGLSVGLRWPPDALERFRAGQLDADNDVKSPLYDADGDPLRREMDQLREEFRQLRDEVRRHLGA